MALWKIPECFFHAENLASGKISGKSGGQSGKLDAENLRILYSCGKSAEKSIDWKICGKIGKSGKSENVKYI